MTPHELDLFTVHAYEYGQDMLLSISKVKEQSPTALSTASMVEMHKQLITVGSRMTTTDLKLRAIFCVSGAIAARDLYSRDEMVTLIAQRARMKSDYLR